MHTELADQPGDPIGDDTRFARPRASQDEKRSFAMGHGFALLWIESGKIDHWVAW
jgi:hypothetical protein